MIQAKYWYHVHHRDIRAVSMADRHYSRQKPGTPEFTRPGHKIVLLHFDSAGRPAALWASQRPAPGKARRADGLDAWDCSMFRVELSTVHASELIREAVAITLGLWGEQLPGDGIVTTVNPRKVEPIIRRGRAMWGYCFFKAGWTERGITKERKLVMWEFTLPQLRQIEPIAALKE